MEDLAAAMKEMTASMKAVRSTVDESQSMMREMGTWKPQVDGALQYLRADITTLRQQLGRVALNPILGLDPHTLQARANPVALEGGGVAAAAEISDGGRRQGHGELPHHRRGLEGNLTLTTPPAMGMFRNLENSVHDYDSSFLYRGGSGSGSNRGPRPRIDFPMFVGERPKSWKRQCEAYFRVFDISPECWVDTATMHFAGGASIWLENTGIDIEKLSWSALCNLVCGKFGRNEFQKLLRQLFHMKQMGSVVEYIQEFTEVMHALKAHTTAWDPELLPSRFVDGLKEEIKVVVLVHQPKNLDIAVSLALLQEEAMDIWRNREPRRGEGSFPYARSNYKVPALVTTSADKLATSSSAQRATIPAEDKRGLENARHSATSTAEDRTASLNSFRRSRGLCFVCGEKWAPGHKCATTVQLHVVQEMLDALGLDSVEDTVMETETQGELLAISQAAVAGTDAPNTFRLLGQIQKQQVLMLIDSGSSHCFVSETIASQLQGVERAVAPIQVKIADGATMTCSKELVGCEWWCQGVTFKTNLKVLPLGGYDVIIGMDWLQSHNPMGIDWKDKRLAFWDQGKLVQLKGLQVEAIVCKEVEPGELLTILQQAGITGMVQIQCMEEVDTEESIPSEIDQVLNKFPGVFAEPTELPPPRAFDHAIPLIPGAKPVNLRPYRYNPEICSQFRPNQQTSHRVAEERQRICVDCRN